MFTTACPEAPQALVQSTLGVVQQVFEEKCIGLPTLEGRMHKGKFQNLQSKLSKFLMELGDGLLAQSACEILIKAIAQAIPAYVMGFLSYQIRCVMILQG
jgi:hypothetical protein